MNNLRGAKIIYQESKATQPSHLYFLQKDENYYEAIVTSESGVKRKLNINVDLSNYYTKNETDLLLEDYYLKTETYNQNEIDGFLDLKADLSQLNDYYKKNETLSQTEINDLLNNKQNNLGYTPENLANKSDSYTASSSTTYASSKALVDGLATKLDKPTTTGNTTNFPYVVGEDGNGNSARLPAGDLGKNFFNSDLSNTTARNHTMNAAVTVNTLGNPHTLSGLPNKNTDIANFRKVRVQNASGLDAIVDSKNILIDMPSQLSDTEKTAWKTAMNGGWTTNTMSISTIVPYLIPFGQDVNTTIFITGANLNLPPTTFTVEILDINNNVVAMVPNNQVNLVSSGALNFYFNFKNLPIAEYKIRLWNGVAYYTSVSKIKIINVSNITNIDFGHVGWDLLKQATDTTTQIYGNSLTIAEVGTAGSLVTSILSGKFAESNENFIIELVIQTSNKNTNYPSVFFKVGLTDRNVTNSLVSNQFIFHGLGKSTGGQVLIRYLNSGQGTNFANGTSTSSYSFKLTIIKQDNQLILIDPLGNGSFTTLINSSGYKLSVQIIATGNSELFGVNIISAYKF